LNSSKTKVVASTILGKILSVIGYAVIIFYLIGFIAIITEPGNLEGAQMIVLLILWILFFTVGLLFIIPGYKIKKRIRRFKNYVTIISSENITSIDILATKTSQSVDYVRNDLQKMIDKKYFPNAYIDRDDNEIIIGSTDRQEHAQKTALVFADPVSVQCASCGAMNKKENGTTSTCEYCGSAI
jgi:ABC-type multidrug transport system fused ATPase/permease subunit